jgi:hypothetical protein
VRFFAHDQRRLVPCAVTRKALMAAAGKAALERDSPLYMYRRLKKEVQAVASEKYRAHELEQGAIVVHKRDLLAKARPGLAAGPME